MCRHGHGWRRADHLVLDVPLSVDGVLLGEVQRAGDNSDGGVLDGQSATKVLKVRPVITVEALADLGAHVGEVEGIVHGLLRPLAVGGGHLMAAIKPAAEVILEQGAELGRHGVVLDEVAVLAVAVLLGQRRGRDVLGHPMRVSQFSVVARHEARAAREVVYGAGEAILKEAGGVNEATGAGGRWEPGCGRRKEDLARGDGGWCWGRGREEGGCSRGGDGCRDLRFGLLLLAAADGV